MFPPPYCIFVMHLLYLLYVMIMLCEMWSNNHYTPVLFCMMMSSNGNIFCVTGPLCGEFTGHQWIPLPRPVMQSFDVICAWTNGWVNNHDTSDLRRHCTHYGVTVMNTVIFLSVRHHLFKVLHYVLCNIIQVIDESRKTNCFYIWHTCNVWSMVVGLHWLISP